MPERFQDKVVVISRGSRGIATAFAREGCRDAAADAVDGGGTVGYY